MPSDEAQVLAINAGAQPGVAALGHGELSRLQTLSRGHIVAAQGEVVLGYTLSFTSADAYDGEEFLALRSLITQPFVYIDQVAILRTARGSGIGRRLYNTLEHVALHWGASYLCCEVNTVPPNPDSFAFHSRLGFTELQALATQDGRNVVLLKKAVIAAA